MPNTHCKKDFQKITMYNVLCDHVLINHYKVAYIINLKNFNKKCFDSFTNRACKTN